MSKVQIPSPKTKIVFLYSPTYDVARALVFRICKESEEYVCDEKRGMKIVRELFNAGFLEAWINNYSPILELVRDVTWRDVNEYILENGLLGKDEYLLILGEDAPEHFTALVVNEEALNYISNFLNIAEYNVSAYLVKNKNNKLEKVLPADGEALKLSILLTLERLGKNTEEIEKKLQFTLSIEEILNKLSEAGMRVEEVDPENFPLKHKVGKPSYAYKIHLSEDTALYITLW